MPRFLERHAESIEGALSCFDRMLIQGTFPDICHPGAITRFFYSNNIRIFDFTRWAEPLKEGVRADVQALAKAEGLEIEPIKRFKSFRKEDRIEEILQARGRHPGVVHIFSAMETCTSYRPWHDKSTHRTFLLPDSGKCVHYYVYFIAEKLGLCHLRIPTWVPFRLQFCFNGHNWLAAEMRAAGIEFTQVDNAFVSISDFAAAQKLSDRFNPKRLHRMLDAAVRRFAPTVCQFESGVHWSIMQAEYATDLVFSDAETLAPVYEEIVRTLSHAVKPDHVAMFLGKRLDPRYDGELGSSLEKRLQGICLRHFMGSSGIKIYDKFGRILRIECFTNQVGFFKHHRRVEHRDGRHSYRTAALRKTIYSLPDLAGIMTACNGRYLDFLAAVDDPTNEICAVEKISATVREKDRTYRGFNLFGSEDLAVLRAISQAEMIGFGFRNRHLRQSLPGVSSGRVSHILKRLRKHGLLKKVANSFKYYLTSLGKRVVAAALRLREMFAIPSLRGHLATT